MQVHTAAGVIFLRDEQQRHPTKTIIIYENQQGTRTATTVTDPDHVSLLQGLGQGNELRYAVDCNPTAFSRAMLEPPEHVHAVVEDYIVDLIADEYRVLVLAAEEYKRRRDEEERQDDAEFQQRYPQPAIRRRNRFGDYGPIALCQHGRSLDHPCDECIEQLRRWDAALCGEPSEAPQLWGA